MKPTSRPPHRQQGAVLVVALIFLIALTLIGVTVANNNTQQERMAGNTRQHDLAFQAANHAMVSAEGVLGNAASPVRLYIDAVRNSGTLPTLPAGLALNGEAHRNDMIYWKDTFDWSNAGSSVATAMVASLTPTQPRYVIEQMPTADPDGDGKPSHFYRITSWGVGQSANAVAILQTMYQFD